MKKFFGFMLLLASAAFAQPSLTLTVTNQGPIRAGNTVTLQASLSGSSGATMAAFQFNIRGTVPGTWAVQPGATATAAGKQFSCAPPDGVNPDFRCVVYGMNTNTISDGVVGTLTLAVPSNAPDGQVSLIPSNTLGATGAGDAVALAVNTVNFTLASPLSPCDINSDGSTNVQDVTLVISQILGLAPATVDLDNDGKTTIADLMRVVTSANGGACKVGR